MKIAVMGAGGVGGYLGAKLAAAGGDVTFIARGAHLEAMKQAGLRLHGAEDLHLRNVRATDSPIEIGRVDLLLFCVKLYDTVEAAQAIAPIVGPETTVLTLQNGIESAHHVGSIVGSAAMLAGAAYFPANITAPGEVTFFGKMGSRPHIVIGEPGAGESERVNTLLSTFKAAGIEAEGCRNTELMLWEKFLLVVGNSAATSATRCTVGAVCADPDLRWLLHEAISEAATVGRAAGIGFSDDVVDTVMAALDANPADGKSSQLVDLENGRRLELEGLSGAVVRLGRELGVPTPVHSAVYASLKPFRDGVPKS